jgi:hypothetical protein
MDRSKQAVANRLAEAHYGVEPGMELIVQLLAPSEAQEADPKEPVKLLEVNRDTTASGIHPLFFGAQPVRGIFFPCVIIEITPAEYEELQRGTLSLPNGWRLGHEFARVASAGTQ